MANDLKEYIEPVMKIRQISFADIIVTSTPEKEQTVVSTDLPKTDDPWANAD